MQKMVNLDWYLQQGLKARHMALTAALEDMDAWLDEGVMPAIAEHGTCKAMLGVRMTSSPDTKDQTSCARCKTTQSADR